MAAIAGNSLGVITAHSILDQATGILHPISAIVNGSSSAPPGQMKKHHIVFPLARKYMDFVQTEMESDEGESLPKPLPEVPEEERKSKPLEIVPGKLSVYLGLGFKDTIFANTYNPAVVLVNHTTNPVPFILNSRKEDWYTSKNPLVIPPNGGEAPISYYALLPTAGTPPASTYTQVGINLEGVPYFFTISQYVTLEVPGDNTSRPVYPEAWLVVQ